MNSTSPAPDHLVVVDRPTGDGEITSLVVQPGTADFPVRLATTLGYGGASTIALDRDEATALIEAIRVHLRTSYCSKRCVAKCDPHGKRDPKTGWHRDDCPAILERHTVAELQDIIAELVLQLEELGGARS